MPAGVTWPAYLKYMTAAMLSMFAGAQMVHMYYKPLEDIDDYIEREKLAVKGLDLKGDSTKSEMK